MRKKIVEGGTLMPTLDLAYLSGIFDGEGCIGIYRDLTRRKATKKPQTSYRYLRVSVSNTHAGTVNTFLEEWGGFSVRKRRRGANHKICFEWWVTGLSALVFLRDVQPYLRIKKEEAQIAIRFQMTKEERKMGQRKRMTVAEIALEENQSRALHSIKVEGRRG